MIELMDFLKNIGKSAAYAGVGFLLFAMAFGIMCMVVPMRKEIEEDQNTALAILVGSIMLGMAIIVAAAIH